MSDDLETLRRQMAEQAQQMAELQERLRLAEQASTNPTVDVGGSARVQGPVVGLNTGTIQVFFGGKPPEDAHELLLNYLNTLVREHNRLRLGKLLANEQTGREDVTAPTLSLREVYTSLATDVWLQGQVFQYSPKQLIAALDQLDLDSQLPEDMQLPVAEDAQLDIRGGLTAKLAIAGAQLSTTLGRLRENYTALSASRKVTGAWYRPELAVEAVASESRVVLLGEPGSGKSTVLRYLAIAIAEALQTDQGCVQVRGWEQVDLLPVPLFCQLGRVARRLTDDPEQDDQALLDELLRHVEAAGLRPGLREVMLRAWRSGGALLLLDGLDEINGVPEPSAHGLRSRRERVADAIRRLADRIGQSRIVVTCRTRPYEQSAIWQLRDDWQVRRLEPFIFSQVRHFVPAWYVQSAQTPHAKYNVDEAQGRAKQLISALMARRGLSGLTARPLLLTMLVLLHYNRKQLPDERSDVYEELVMLLLERWEGVRSTDQDQRMATIGDRLGIPQLHASELRPVIHEVAFLAHREAVDGRGVLKKEPMQKQLDAFFASKIDPRNPKAVSRARCAAASDTLLTLLREESGLIQEEDDETYVLPHLTFEEYLAACHLAGREDVVLAYNQWCDDPGKWREPLLLMMGRLRQQEKWSLTYSWLLKLVAQHDGEVGKAAVQQQRDALLAADCYAELGGRTAFVNSSHDVIDLEQRLRVALVAVLEDRTQPLPTTERIRAAQALGQLGDPRYAVTSDEWKVAFAARNERFGQAEGYFCYVQPGTYQIGGWEKGAESAELNLPAFWIARYPITVAQYRLFLEQGGYTTERWWTPEGWKWKGSRSAPWRWLEPQYTNPSQPAIGVTWYEAVAFCNWLSEQLPHGFRVRLPTEAEWEVAAAWDGNQRRSYPWGATEPTSELTIYDELQLATAAPVGCCPAGAAVCGAIDLAGNVWEWCTNSSQAYPEQAAKVVEDFTNNSSDVPYKGGSSYSSRATIHCRTRNCLEPGYDDLAYGFRVVVVPHSYG